MPGWMWGLIAALIVIDAAVTIWVIRRVRRRRADAGAGGGARDSGSDPRPIE